MRNIISAILLFGLVSINANAQDKTYFRYKNDQGVQVMSDAIPIKYASKGYQIVNIYGRVVKEVPPELSPEDKARVRKELEEKRRLQRWDEELLSRYSHIEDIKAAKKRKLRGIDTNIFTLRLTLNNISDKIKALQASAAATERQGSKVSDEMLQSIDQLKEDKVLIEEEIVQRQQDKKDITAKYTKDMKRFTEIQNDL